LISFCHVQLPFPCLCLFFLLSPLFRSRSESCWNSSFIQRDGQHSLFVGYSAIRSQKPSHCHLQWSQGLFLILICLRLLPSCLHVIAQLLFFLSFALSPPIFVSLFSMI
jgi:hypothetical protein